MSIRHSISLTSSLGVRFPAAASRTPVSDAENSCILPAVTTGDTLLELGQVTNPREIMVVNVAGGDLSIGFNGSTYPMLLKAEEAMLVLLSGEGELIGHVDEITGTKQKQAIVAVADSSDSLDGAYFTLEGASHNYTIWFKTDSGTAPGIGTNVEIEVDISTNDPAAAVQLAMYNMLSALTAPGGFAADFDMNQPTPAVPNILFLEAVGVGVLTPLAEGGTGFETGFAFLTLVTGTDYAAEVAGTTVYPAIHMKSASTTKVAAMVCQA